MQSLQEHQKWVRPRCNLETDNIVLIKDKECVQNKKNKWQLARVEKPYPKTVGYTRKIKLAIGDPTQDDKGRRTRPPSFLKRPVQKLAMVLLVLSEDNSNRGVSTGELTESR